uniref:Uncharacterized protein n=1 Tax=Lactuca sativa TaxID=4236 RepID=A0A9R1V4N9_LACSA|nr:hypothetical protein LSAT_V11C600326430 [Lactuca sativa]
MSEDLRALQVNILFIETILQTPKYASLLKGLLTNRKNMIEESELNLPKLKLIDVTIHLADKTVIHPKGLCEDLLIKVDKLVFPADFVVLDIEEDPKVPIILGRPFLNIAGTIVDMRESTLALKVGDDAVTFVVNQENEDGKSIENMTSLIELELALWQENNSRQFTSSLDEEFDAQRDLRELEKLLEGNEENEDLSNFEEWLEDEKGVTNLKNKEHNSSIRLHTNNQEEKGDKLIRRTKPRASVSTTFEVFTFKPPDSQAYEEIEEESVTSSDAEMMTKKAIEIDKGGMDTMRYTIEERKNKCGKRIKRQSEGNDTKRRKEELKKAYKRKIHAYKTKYKAQRIKQEFPMEEAAET